MKSLRRLAAAAVRLAAGVALAALAGRAGTAQADTAVLTHAGVVYEISVLRYVDVVPSAAGSSDARLPVVALRTTRPGALPLLELVDGTVTPDEKGSPAIGYDETTDTIFVVYTRYSGSYSDVHFAVRRAGAWLERSLRPSAGLYLSLNSQMIVTRQNYTDVNASGAPVAKSRTIVSIVWWEEGGRSQARYAPVFLEDGQLQLDEIQVFNLNDVAGAGGPTTVEGLPFSSYQFPAVQRDPGSNGGVLVAFANLASMVQSTLRIGFPDDMQQILATGVPAGPQAFARIHTPIGRDGHNGRIPSQINVQTSVGTVIAPTSLVPTFFWTDPASVHVVRGDAPEDAPDTAIPARADFSLDRAISVVRESALAN